MDFSVTILGTSSAIPTSKRNPSAQIVNYDSKFFLLDCGEGTQVQIRKNHFRLSKIDHIFISHLHGDHIYGLFGLISTFSLLGRAKPLHIYSSHKLQELLSFHDSFFNNKLSFAIEFHALEEGKTDVVYQDEKLMIEAFPLKHSIATHGFLFKEKKRARKINKHKLDAFSVPISEIVKIKHGADFFCEDGRLIPNKELTFDVPKERAYAYCTDTAYYPNIIKKIEKVDLLYHEATFCNKDAERAKKTMHSTAEQAATIARDAKVQKLIIGHFSTRYSNLTRLLKEAKQVFNNTEIAEEGQTYIIEEKM